MNVRRIARALAGAAVVALATAPQAAAAQQIETIVAFGDSYADDGNLFQILGFNPAPAVYPTGRFSGGTNYIDTLAEILDADVQNFAIGGALTGNTNTNGVGLPGFQTEFGAFLNGGGGVFPTVSGTFDEDDLLAISIGGNDARFYQQQGGTAAGAPAAAAVSVGQATAGLNALVNAGAQNISFLAGNTAILPEIANDPNAQAIRNAFSTSFNTGIQSTLAGYADDGVIVHYLDLVALRDEIAEDPAAYGLTSLGACTPAPQCVTNFNLTNQFLFYVDNLHLTSAGFAIVARYVAAQLDAPLTLQGPSELGLDTARQFGRTLSSRVDVNGRDPTDPGFRLFLAGDHFSRDEDATETHDQFDSDGVGITLGGEYSFGNGVAGVAANYTRPRLRFGRDLSDIDTKSWQVGAYAGAIMGGFFGQVHAGFGNDRHRIERAGVVDELEARPDGSHIAAGAKAGYLLPVWKFRAGPVVAIDYARAKVDSYTEEGDTALALNVGRQNLSLTTGQIGIEGRGSLIEGLRSFVSLTAERELSGNARVIRFSQTTAPGIVNQWDVSRRDETYGRFTSGTSVDLWEGVSLNTNVTRTFRRKGGEDLGLQVGFKAGF
jgi:phospholipase/lecithinase/hemolysin/uncharacterized protein YhjY with autotransporter beta-barrel domain